jgi:phosphoglycolate phosphatase-like HAD superfamily hydrolase
MIKLVAIDFDETLCMTEESTYFIENSVAVSMGHDPMSREVHQKTWGQELEMAIQERVPGINVEKFMKLLPEAHMIAVEEGNIDIVSPENIQALDKILENNLRLALLTSRSIDEANHLMHETHPLNTRMVKYYYKENSDFLKPDPRVFDKVLKDFDLKPYEIVYVGDAVSDAVAAKGAGLHFVAVLEGGIRVKEDFKHLPVDYFATTFLEATNYILSLTSKL